MSDYAIAGLAASGHTHGAKDATLALATCVQMWQLGLLLRERSPSPDGEWDESVGYTYRLPPKRCQ
jgi:hypothetical protein